VEARGGKISDLRERRERPIASTNMEKELRRCHRGARPVDGDPSFNL